jgi:NADPH-dependent 2,4-dienoyl-CoA reductase/sulfur reductase-like enzyme/rhodanese-related sulfurtransferase
MPSRTIVVVGGALSGPTAAARAREIDETARIILLEQGAAVSYAVGGLAYRVSGEVSSRRALEREDARFFNDVYRVDIRTGVRVQRIDAGRHVVTVDGQELSYDSLIYAAGAESIVPDVAGLEGADNVFRFRTMTDLQGITARLKRGARRVTILGGGYFGVEAADGFLRRGCRVTVVEREMRILGRHSPAMSRMAADALERAGARIVTGAAVASVARKGSGIRAVTLTDGGTIKTDLLIVAAGVRPRTSLLREAGVPVLADGTVSIDARAATSVPDVFACGVCVSVPCAPTGEPVWLPQAAIADKTAQVAGVCAAGGDARLGPVVGTTIVRAGKLTVACAGMIGAEAGFQASTVDIHAPSHDRFFPDATPVSIALTYHQPSGRVLGAEIAGRTGVDKRIDVVATAIAGGLTVEQLAALDLAYAPPYSAARDPVNVAGTVAGAARAGLAVAWTADQVAADRDGLTLIDVRVEAERRRRGTIRGARGVPFAFLRKDPRLAGGRLVFVSETGQQAYLAARIAQAAGMRDAGFLSGGLRSWSAAGYPLTRPKGGRS